MSLPVERYRSMPQANNGSSANLADILERVLDKGVVIAGDVVINLLDIELLTIKLRLLIASVDTARKMGIDWWENDPFLTGGKRREIENGSDGHGDGAGISERLDRIESALQALQPAPPNGEDTP